MKYLTLTQIKINRKKWRITDSYIGIWKTEIEKCLDGSYLKENKEIEEDESHVYICTKRDGQIYRYDDNTLIFYCPSIKAGNRIYERLNELGLVTDFDSGDSEVRISFKEFIIYEVAKIVGATIRGKDVVPFNPKSEKTPNNFDYNIYVNGKLKKKNLSLLKANIYLDKYRHEYGFENVKREMIK